MYNYNMREQYYLILKGNGKLRQTFHSTDLNLELKLFLDVCSACNNYNCED